MNPVQRQFVVLAATFVVIALVACWLSLESGLTNPLPSNRQAQKQQPPRAASNQGETTVPPAPTLAVEPPSDASVADQADSTPPSSTTAAAKPTAAELQEAFRDAFTRAEDMPEVDADARKEAWLKARQLYLELQQHGEEGLEAALLDFVKWEKVWGLCSGDEARLDQLRQFWGSKDEYMRAFDKDLIVYGVGRRGNLTMEAVGLVLLQNISHKPQWDRAERVKLAAAQLMEPGDSTMSHNRRQAAVQPLMLLPCAESAAVAAEFLQSGAEPAWARHDAVWVLARVGRDEDFAVIRWAELKDPDQHVRGTAEFHRLARGVKEPGFMVQGIDPNGTGFQTTLKVGDVIRWEGSNLLYSGSLLPRDFGHDLQIQVQRQESTFDETLPAGTHGLKLRMVPPAFPVD